MKTCLPIASAAVLLCGGLLQAQEITLPRPDGEVNRQIHPPRRLPTLGKTQPLELERFSQRLVRLPNVEAEPVGAPPIFDGSPVMDVPPLSVVPPVRLVSRTISLEMANGTMAGPETTFSQPQSASAESLTLDELKAEMKKLAWTKGDVRVVPYGVLWGSALYGTGRTNPGPFTLFVPSLDSEGEDAFVIDTRRTRIGLDVAGPSIQQLHSAHVGGKIEIDFHGAFVVENKPGVLLRHAYGEIKNDEFRLLAGQTWDIISPLYPGTMSYSVGWGGGNIGYRRMQIRLEKYITLSDRIKLTAAGSLNQNIVSDFNAATGVDPEASDWPLLEGRLGAQVARCGTNCEPIAFGVSGHIGEQGFDFTGTGPAPLNLPPRDDARVQTWSLNFDMRVPVTDRMGVQGEFFMGENLGTFLGGIVQGVDRTSRRGIRSMGGWFDVWYDWLPCLHSRGGFGIDDPRDNDLSAGRIYNHFLFVNSSFDLTERLTVGVELTSWKTLHIGQRPGESVQFEFTGKYVF